MTFNYYIQHKIFKKILEQVGQELVKEKIESEDAQFFTDLIMDVVNYMGERVQEDTSGIAYETSIISVGDTKVTRCKYTGTLPLNSPECSSILIAVTDKIYYFTVEVFMRGGYMFCGWDDERHLNYGAIEADDPVIYTETMSKVLNH